MYRLFLYSEGSEKNAMKLTHKQRLFADEFLKCGNATEAALKAGYSKKTARSIGSENLAKPDIKSYIAEKRQEIESHKIADAKEVMEFYSAVLRGEKKETVVIATPAGMETTTKEADLKTRISAAKELMKRYPLSDDDPMQKQAYRKIKAEADILEAKASLLVGNTNDTESMLQGFLEKLEGEIDEPGKSIHAETDRGSENSTE